MATAIRIPDIGTTVDQVKLISWLKDEGETVARGEPLCEVETDKATSDLESAAAGTLLKQLVVAGTEGEQGTIIAYIGTPGDEIPADSPGAVAPGVDAPGVDAPKAAATRAPARITPLVRNIALKEGVNLDLVVGTGPGGRITREDVYRARDDAQMSKEAGKPLNGNQLVVARRVTRSQMEIPAINLSARIDMGMVMQKRVGLASEHQKVSYEAFIIAAVAAVLGEFPHFRSTLVAEEVFEKQEVNVGVAIGRGYELFTPVLSKADRLSLSEIELALKTFKGKAEAGTFTADDFAGATLTVSNLGMYPIRDFTAIIPPDQVAIVSIGSIDETDHGAIFTLSVDHRLINGREGAEFLTALKRKLEET